jgi:3-hydroxyisobutyrate dehydrogenase-like beta-hydroxyacid dehydrogenase
MPRIDVANGPVRSPTMRIAIVGMGSMGRAFATRALEKGYDVTVWNRTPGRAAPVVAAGASEAGSPGEAAARADAVLVVLADDAAVLDVCLGAEGVLASLGPSAVCANVSTVAPSTVRRLADAGPEARVLDSPVMGSPTVVAAGHGSFLIGGSTAAIAAVEPLWTDLGSGYTHCGPNGTGAVMKIVQNLLLIAGVAALAEGIVTARENGLPAELIERVMAESGTVSPAGKARLASLFDPSHPGWFSPVLARKDIRLAVGLAEQAGIPARIGPATETLLTTLVDAGGHWPDFAAVIEALEP